MEQPAEQNFPAGVPLNKTSGVCFHFSRTLLQHTFTRRAALSSTHHGCSQWQAVRQNSGRIARTLVI